MNRLNQQDFFAVFCVLLWWLPGMLNADQPTDQRALEGVAEGKAIFDVNLGNPSALVVILDVVNETLDGLAAHGVEADLIVAFRGPSGHQRFDDPAVGRSGGRAGSDRRSGAGAGRLRKVAGLWRSPRRPDPLEAYRKGGLGSKHPSCLSRRCPGIAGRNDTGR